MNTMQRTAKRFKKSEWRDIMLKQITTDEFIKGARKVHGDKYDYSKSVYTGAAVKLTVICKKHGEFCPTPANHCNGSGCKKCGYESNEISLSVSQNEFIERATRIHKNKYIYADTVYTKTHNKIKIICPVHGEFYQTAGVHLRGFGCIKCRSDRNTNTTEDFIKLAKKIHGDKYNYSETVYTNSNIKVTINCPRHGNFKQLPNSHAGKRIKSQCGCPKCYQERHKTSTEKIVKECKKVHKNFYDYSKTRYIDADTKIKIICPTHGVFSQLPFSHRAGQGCKKCTSNVSNKETKFLDEIKIPKRSRQKRIKKYLVDGVHKNVVYEFLGDYWHGNPSVHKQREINKVTKTTFGELYVATFKKFKTLHELGYRIKYIWELDWDEWNKTKSSPLKIHEYKNH